MPVTKAGDMAVDLAPARECRNLAEEWRGLEARADCSFFQSWSWIGTWLAELPKTIDPLCLRARLAGETVGLALLTPYEARRHGFVTARQLHLHATGGEEDRLTVEHNGFLVDRRCAAGATAALLRHLAGLDIWEELALPGVDPSMETTMAALGRVILLQRSRCPHVDLSALGSGSYLDGLGANTRHQLRRAHRLYGGPELDAAGDQESAAAFLAGLEELHDARWRSVGKDGAFAGDFLKAFHRRLVMEGVANDTVQLLRTRTGDGRTIGYLYNFLHRGSVYAYQSGFETPADNRLKPGLVSHHLAIEMNRAAGRAVYDFLAGDSRYKRSLANGASELVWLVVQRPAGKFRIENLARALKSLLRA